MSKHRPYGIYERFFKRFLDILCSLLAIIVFSWLLALVALLVRIKLGSPVLFKQDRPGRNEKIFKLCKFRTMTDARDENGKLLPDDVRLTKFGRMLRKSSLDELPELFNILRGDMSIVGPRPLLVSYLPWYTEEERHRHDVRPGLTGYAQVNGRNTTPWDVRLAHDVAYVNHITFIGDVKIIAKTVVKTLKRSDILMGSQIPAGKLDDARRKMRDESINSEV